MINNMIVIIVMLMRGQRTAPHGHFPRTAIHQPIIIVTIMMMTTTFFSTNVNQLR